MNTITLKEKDINPKHRIKSQGQESTIYSIDGMLYKFFNTNRMYKKEIIVEALNDNPIVNTPTPIDKLVSPQGKFLGYTMEQYKKYSSLNDFLNGFEAQKYNYDERRQACIDLLSTVNMIMQRGFYYWDMHGENVLYKKGNIKVIDADSMICPRLGVTYLDKYLGSISNPNYGLMNVDTVSTTISMMISLLMNINESNYYPIESKVNYRDVALLEALFKGKIFSLVRHDKCSMEEVIDYFDKDTTLSLIKRVKEKGINY